MSFFYGIRDIRDLSQLMELASIDEKILYRFSVEFGFDVGDCLSFLENGKNIIIVSGDWLLRRYFLFFLLNKILDIGGLVGLYFAKLPTRFGIGNVDFRHYDYLVIEDACLVNWSLYGGLWEDIRKSGIKLILTSSRFEEIKFLDKSDLNSFKVVELKRVGFDAFKRFILSRYHITSEEIKALYGLTGGDLDISLSVLNALSRGYLSKNIIYGGDLRLFVNNFLLRFSSAFKDVYDILYIAKKSYLNAIPLALLNKLYRGYGSLEDILYWRYFQTYALFKGKLLDLVKFPPTYDDKKYLNRLFGNLRSGAREIEEFEEINFFFKNIAQKFEFVEREILKDKILEKVKQLEKSMLEKFANRRKFGLRWLLKLEILDDRNSAEDTFKIFGRMVDENYVGVRLDYLDKIRKIFYEEPRIVISQFIPVTALGGSLGDLTWAMDNLDLLFFPLDFSKFGEESFIPTHNYLYLKFVALIDRLSAFFIKEKYIVLLKNLVKDAECLIVSKKDLECFNSFRELYLFEEFIKKFDFSSFDELKDWAKNIVLKIFKDVFEAIKLVLEIEKGAREDKANKRFLEMAIGIKNIKSMAKKVFKELLEILKVDKNIKEAVRYLVGEEYINKVIGEIKGLMAQI